MAHAIRSQLSVWDRKVAQLTVTQHDLMGELESTQQQLQLTPGDDTLQTKITHLNSQIVLHEEFLTSAKASCDDLKDILVGMADERVNSSTRSNGNASVRLVAPKPYQMGDDFDTFAELFLNYTANEHLDTQIQVLQSLLSLDAFRAGKSAFTGTWLGSSIADILQELKTLVAPKATLATLIAKFSNCTQRPNESLELFASRIRSTGLQAYPNLREIEPYLIAQFLQGVRAGDFQKHIMRAAQPATLNLALSLASELSSSTGAETAHIDEMTPQRAKPMYQPPQTSSCSVCGKTGHTRASCRMKDAVRCQLCQRFFHSAAECRNVRVDNGRSDSIRCQLCGNAGHAATQCRAVKFVPTKASQNPGFQSTYRNAAKSSQNSQQHPDGRVGHSSYAKPNAMASSRRTVPQQRNAPKN